MINYVKHKISERKSLIKLGKIQKSLKRECLSEAQLNHHVHIVGASGFGKTVLISHIVKQRIEQGKGLLFIDLKADIDTIEKFSGFAKSCGRAADLQVFSLTDEKLSSPYNLISEGSATQLRDRIMLSLNWSEEFYKNQSASFLLKLLIGLCWLRDHRDLKIHLGVVLKAASDPRYLEELCLLIPHSELKVRMIFEEAVRFLNTADSFKSLQGLRSQIESIVLSDFGERVASSENGISLFQAVRENKIVFLFLDSRRFGETAKTIGKFILQDLKSASARVDAEIQKIDRKAFTVIIDEFADLASEDFIGFLDRARSSKMSIVVAHQEICDLQRISPEFAGRLMGNTSTLYAFLQKRPESAELISGIAGTKSVRAETHQYSKLLFFDTPTGNKSVREVETFMVHPNVVKSLPVGVCVCVKKYPVAQAYVVRVQS